MTKELQAYQKSLDRLLASDLSIQERSAINSDENFIDSVNIQEAKHVIKHHRLFSSIKEIEENQSQEVLNRLLARLIVDVADFFSVGKGLTEEMIIKLCLIIREVCWRWKLVEVKICFRKAMKSKYGPLYDRLDGGVIMQWLNEYSKERSQEIVIWRSQQDAEHKKPQYNEKVLEAIKTGFKQPELKKKKSTIYQSIEQYCDDNGIGKEQYIGQLVKNIEKEYDPKHELTELWAFKRFKLSQHLAALNDHERED